MDLPPIAGLVAQLTSLAHELDGLALFLILAVEEAGIYVPLPGNWLMALAGVRVAQGAAIWYGVYGAGVAATTVGACALYLAARRGGRPLLRRHGHRLGLTTTRQARVEAALVRHGALAVFLGRLVPGVRCGSSFAAGLFGIAFAPFLAATIAAAAVWWGFWLGLGWALGPVVLETLDATIGDLLLIAALLSLGGTALMVARSLGPRGYVLGVALARSATNALSRSFSSASTRPR